jgi:ArsR family transcriptional regulator, arsenate/arsenite/antimonite-responsive transcriptional repressor
MSKTTKTLGPATFFKCLSDDTRLKSLLLLQLKKELCVCELMSALQESQPKVSRHLADLRACGLVLDERQGKWVYYRINKELPAWALKILALTAREQPPDYLAACIERLEQPENACC